MAVTAKFQADFSGFVDAINKAEVKLVDLSKGANKVEGSLNRMVDGFSGRRVIQEAALMAVAVEKAGGIATLTAKELERIGSVATEAAEKMKKLGHDVPASIQQIADATKGAGTEWDTFVKGFSVEQAIASPLGTAKAAVIAFTESMGAVAVTAAATVASIAAVGVAVYKLAANAAAVGGNLDDMADKTGMSVPALSRLQNAAAVAGTDLNTLTDAVFKIEQRMGEGGKKWDAALKKMGLSTEDLRNAGPDRLLDIIATGLAGIADPSERAATGVALMGKGFKDVVPILADLNSALLLTNDITPWTAAQAADAEHFEMQMASLVVHAEALGTALGRDLIPYVSAFVSVASTVGAVLADVIGRFSGITSMLNLVGGAWSNAAAAIEVFRGTAATIPPIAGEASKGLEKWRASVSAMTPVLKTEAALLIEEDFAMKELARNLDTLTKQRVVDKAAAKAAAEAEKKALEIFGSIHKQTYDMAQEHVKKWRDEALTAAALVNKGIIDNLNDELKFRRQHDESIRKITLNEFNFQRSEVDQWLADEKKALEARGGNWERAWTSAQQVAVDSLAAITKAERLAFEPGGAQFAGPIQQAKQLKDGLGDLSTAFAQLAQISGDSFGGIVKDIAQITGALALGQKAAEQFKQGGVTNLVAGSVGIVGAMDQATKSTSRTAATLGGMATGMKIGAQIAGPYGAAIGAAAGALIGFFRSAGAAERAINPLREKFVQTAGGLAELDKKAHAAGVTLAAMLNAKNPEQYKKALDELTAALDLQASAMDTLNETVERYGFSIEELGPAFAAQKLNEKAMSLFKDYQVLTAGGVDHLAILEKMGPAMQEYVTTALKAGVAIPKALKPMLQDMVKLGLLTDASGEKLTDLEGLTFAETLDEKFTTLIDTIQKLADAITRGVGGAIAAIPKDVDIHVGYTYDAYDPPARERDNYAAGGGLVTGQGVQYLAKGGKVLQFAPRGTDTVPAMLTPGEGVVSKRGMKTLGAAGLSAINRGGWGGGAQVVGLNELRSDVKKLTRQLLNADRRLPERIKMAVAGR